MIEKLGIRKLQLRDAAQLILRNEGGGGGEQEHFISRSVLEMIAAAAERSIFQGLCSKLAFNILGGWVIKLYGFVMSKIAFFLLLTG